MAWRPAVVGDLIRLTGLGIGQRYGLYEGKVAYVVEVRGGMEGTVWFRAVPGDKGSLSRPGLIGVWNRESRFTIVKEAVRVAGSKKDKLVQCWEDAEAILKSGVRRALLLGIPGTGKTFAARHTGADKRRVFNIYIQPETPAIDLIGHDIVTGGDMVWRDGPAIRAWRQGGRLVVNEIDKASDDCLTALLAICDDRDSAGMELPSGEYVEPHENFQVVATMNGYIEELPEALADRFIGAAVEITEAHPLAILALAEDLQDLARQTSHAGIEEERRVTIRQFRGFEEMRDAGVPEAVAARVAFRTRSQDMVLAIAATRERIAEENRVRAATRKPVTKKAVKSRGKTFELEVT